MDAYQTPETAHEENWWTLVQLAYLQLWLAREEAMSLPRPWERYLPRFQSARRASVSTESPSAHTTADPVQSAPEDSPSTVAPSPPEPRNTSAAPSPSDVQRDFGRIMRQIGTPARPPKPRGKAPGRRTGERVVLRVRVPIVKKSLKTRHQEQAQQQRAP